MRRLSLIIATYNRSEQLMVTLRSVATQSAEPLQWECIVVDNNSQDDTRQRVEEFASAHTQLCVRYLFEPKQGLSHARNAGIVAAEGEILAFIDDDERIVEEFVEAYIDIFDGCSEAMSAGGKIIAEYPSGRPSWMSRYVEQPIANPMDFGPNVRRFPKGRIPGGGNMAFRREVFDRIGLFNTELGRTGKRLIGGEESDLFERAERCGMACYYQPRAVMYHIIPESKLTDDYFERLSYNTGVSQRRRAEVSGRVLRLYMFEVAKWVATLLLCLVHHPEQARYLVKMRRGISRGIFSK